MNFGVFLILGVLIVLILLCTASKKSSGENYYYTQPYYPYYYSSGYGSADPYVAYGYKGPGSYDYPGYGPAFNYQKNANCKIGCTTKYEYGNQSGKVEQLNNCLAACEVSNPYGSKKNDDY